MKKSQFIFWFAGLGIIWGGSFIIIAKVVHAVPPFFGAASRIFFASFFLAIIAKLRGEKLLIPLKMLPSTTLLGLLTVGIPFALLFWGEKFIPPGLAGVLNGTVPIWTAAFYLFMSKVRSERLSRPMLAGLALGFFGILTIFAPQLEFPLHDQELFGGLAVLGMAVSYALGNVAGYKILNRQTHISLETITFHQHLASFIFLGLLSLFFERQPHFYSLLDDRSTLAGIIYLGLVPSALGFTIYFRLLKKVGAVTAGAIAYLVPIAALGFDFIFGNHIPEWNGFAGMILILTGLKLIRS